MITTTPIYLLLQTLCPNDKITVEISVCPQAAHRARQEMYRVVRLVKRRLQAKTEFRVNRQQGTNPRAYIATRVPLDLTVEEDAFSRYRFVEAWRRLERDASFASSEDEDEGERNCGGPRGYATREVSTWKLRDPLNVIIRFVALAERSHMRS